MNWFNTAPAATTTTAPATTTATFGTGATGGGIFGGATFGATTTNAAATTTTTAATTTATAPATTTTTAPTFGTAPAAATATFGGAAPATTSLVPAGPPSILNSSVDDYSLLLSLVQDGWSGSVEVDQLRRVIMQYSVIMAQVQESPPSAKDKASIQSKNVEMDGMKLDLSDERTVNYILELSQLLHLNEVDSLKLVYQAAQSLARTSPDFARGSGSEVQAQIKTRAIELFYKRRFNLLTALLDLVLMERSGAGSGGGLVGLAEEDPIARVVGEAVSELVRLGVTRNVMIAIEAAYHYPTPTPPTQSTTGTQPAPVVAPTPPLLASYRATELAYLLRILFALFRSGSGAGITHDVSGEDLLRLVELLQTRSSALTKAVQDQQDALAKAQAGQKLLQSGTTQQPLQPSPSPTPTGPDPNATFNCYVLLFSLIAALECKYHNLSGSLSARSDLSTDHTTAANQANADADLAQVLRVVQSKIIDPTNWSHDVLRCGTLLSWSLFLRRVRTIAPGTEFTEEEVQNLVLEGLGGSENTGFWIDLWDQIQTNPSFAGLRKDGSLSSTTATTTNITGPAASASVVGINPSASSLVEELSDVLGEFLFHCLVHHHKEMDLLRREDNKTQIGHLKQLQRYQQIIQQQQQQHLYQLHQHGHGVTNINTPELPRAPKLNFASFLSTLTTVVQATPSLIPVLWTAPEFERFLTSELHDVKSLNATQSQIHVGGPFGQHQQSGSLLSGSSATSFHHSSSSSSTIFTSESPFSLLYLDLLSALCADALTAMNVYNFVRHCSRVNWELIITNFFQQTLIQNYLPQVQPTQSQLMDQRGRGYGQTTNTNYRTPVTAPTPPPLTPRQLQLLSSLLNLLSSLLRPSPALQSFFATHPDWKLLDTLFALLGLPGLSVHIKARVILCIGSTIRLNVTQSSQTWERLERSQILPTINYANVLMSTSGRFNSTGMASPTLEGLLFDLEEIENNLQTYPLTGSFLNLLLTLLESTPLPRQLGQGIRNAGPTTTTSGGLVEIDTTITHPGLYGITPYISFVISRVFLNLPHRLYANPMEQFSLSELCLSIFNATVQDWLSEMQSESIGVRVDGDQGGSFQARHMSHTFNQPTTATSKYNLPTTGPSNAQRALQSLAVHPAYTILRDLLSAKEMLQQILTTLTVAFVMLENEGAVSETGQAQVLSPGVEGTLLASLRLLWTVLEKEEQIVDTLQRIDAVTSGSVNSPFGSSMSGRYTTLSSLLLQHQPSILTLAKSVGYIQSHPQTSVQQLLSEKVSRAAARRRSKGQTNTDAQNQTLTNQSMYEEEVEDETMLAAATNTATTLEEPQPTEVAFYAASTLLLLSVRDDSRLVHILEANQAILAVIAAFQRQLKNVQLPTLVPGEIQDPDLQCNKARLVILDLLLSSLQSPSPATPHISLAFALLGFDIATSAAVQQTDLLRSTRRDLFDTLFFDLSIKPGFGQHFPTLSQSVLQLLYKLLSHPFTSRPTVRCIKAHPRGDGSVAMYFTRLMHSLPIVSDVTFLTRLIRTESGVDTPAIISTSGASNQVHQSLFQLSWVLKSMNLHYFLSVGAAARSRNASMTEEWMVDEELDRYLFEFGFLENDSDMFENGAAVAETTSADWLNTVSNSSFLALQNQSAAYSNQGPTRSGVKLLDILANLDVYLRAILPTSFQLESLPTVIGASTSSAGFELASLKYFDPQHNSIQYSLSDVYSSCIAHGLTPKEAYAETRKCLEWNTVTGVLGCAKQAFEGWKQSVEVILLNSSEVLIRKNSIRFESILIQLLQTLLQKLVVSDESNSTGSTGGSSLSIWIALGEELSSLSLTVIAKLREVLQFSSAQPHLDSSLGLSSSPRSSQLHSILSLLVSAILSTRHSSTRINLYAIFLNYILYSKERNEYIEKNLTPAAIAGEDDVAAQQSHWISIQQEQLRLDSENLSLLSSHNLPLLTLVVNDALDGSSKLRSVSFRFLNMMLLGSSAHSSFQIAARSVVDKKNTAASFGPSRFFSERTTQSNETLLPSTYTRSCLSIFQKNNLLLLFLNQIKSNDEAIQAAIYSGGSNALQHYDLLLNLECCLSFFLQLAMSPEGAQMMVEYQLVRVLTSLNFLTSRPAPSGHFVGEYENQVNGNAVPTPFEKYQSIYLLVLQLLVQLLQSLPNHATLVSQIQRFLESAHHDTLASIIKDSLAQVTVLSLQLLSTGLSLVYQMLKEERASSYMTGRDARRFDEHQRSKVQKLGRGQAARQTGSMTYELPPNQVDQPTQQLTFTSFTQKYQPFILLLLARYAHPQSSPRLRSYLTAYIRAVQSQQQDRLDPTLDLLLERGDETMQIIFRKVLAILVVQVAPNQDGDVSSLVLFGPHLGDGGESGWNDENQDAHNPATPQLELLLSILQENHSRLQTSHRQIFTLKKNLEQLSQNTSTTMAPTATSNLYPNLNNNPNSTSLVGLSSNVTSSIAALELEYFPPSSASAFFYQELDSSQRVKLLHQKLQTHLRMHQEQTEKYVWNIEHALILFYHHVRIYLPPHQTHRQAISVSGQPAITPTEFRSQAEATLLPILSQIGQTMQTTTAPNQRADESNRSDQLDIYRPQVLIDTYQARLSSTTVKAAASFITSIIHRINKQVLG